MSVIYRSGRAHWLLVVAGIAIIAAAAVWVVRSRSTGLVVPTSPPSSVERVRVASSTSMIGTSVALADDTQEWPKHGLEAATSYFVTGKLCLDAVLGGSAEFGVVADSPLAQAAVQNREFRIIAAVAGSSRHVRLVVRKDRGITSLGGLKGRSIAVSEGTISEFFLDLCADQAGLKKDDLTRKNLRPPDIVSALVAGHVDAGVTWEPSIQQIRLRLGAAAVELVGPTYHMTAYVVVRPSLLTERPIAVERFLQTVIAASETAKRDPQRAVDVVARRMEVNRDDLAAVWPGYDFDVTLTPSHVDAMQGQIAWALSKADSATAKQVDARALFAEGSLARVAPSAVTLRP